jgi:SagB-type dehydrogenase family enzyme
MEWSEFNKKTKMILSSDAPVPPASSLNPYIFDRIHFKTYPRMKKVPMRISQPKASLSASLRNRKSIRELRGPLDFGKLCSLLHFSAGLSTRGDLDKSRRNYPSAGARYPLEVYIVALNVRGLDEGVYHYNVRDGNLEVLLKGDQRKIMNKSLNQDWTKGCAAVILVTAVFNRNTIKYSDRGYRYVLLDCGHMSQNVYLCASALGIGCCAIGGFWDDKLNELLDVNGEDESVIYVLAVGKAR